MIMGEEKIENDSDRRAALSGFKMIPISVSEIATAADSSA